MTSDQKLQLRNLIAEHMKQDEIILQAAKAKEMQSEIVKQIIEITGEGKRIPYNGTPVLPVKRASKKTGETSYYLRGRDKDDDVITVD